MRAIVTEQSGTTPDGFYRAARDTALEFRAPDAMETILAREPITESTDCVTLRARVRNWLTMVRWYQRDHASRSDLHGFLMAIMVSPVNLDTGKPSWVDVGTALGVKARGSIPGRQKTLARHLPALRALAVACCII